MTKFDTTSDQIFIRTKPQPLCIICNQLGRPLYFDIHDRLCNISGKWSYSKCNNNDCGLIWLNQMPLEEDIHLAYKNYYTHLHNESPKGHVRDFLKKIKKGYLANHFGYTTGVGLITRLLGILPWLYPGRTAELDFSVMRLNYAERGRHLDIGAGSGWLVEHMNQLGWRSEGLDFDIRSVKSAQERGLLFHQGGLHEQNFPDACFDAITMSHCIEHFHDPLFWLKEVRRILKPGGRLSIVTPNSKSFIHLKFEKNWFAIDPPRHLYIFNSACLGQLLQDAGFYQSSMFTSIRDANGYFIGSREIKKNGSYNMMESRHIYTKISGKAMQLVEVFIKLFDRSVGEEIVVLSHRS